MFTCMSDMILIEILYSLDAKGRLLEQYTTHQMVQHGGARLQMTIGFRWVSTK